MKRAALLALLLASCGKPAHRGPDGYVFERREFDRPAVLITKVEHRNLAELQAEARRLRVNVEAERNLQAFGFVAARASVCTIHFVAPENAPAVRLWMGHELAHCFYGRWHS